MSETAENYSPISIREILHSQAIKVWAIALSVVLIWVIAIMAPPILTNTGVTAASIYSFFSYICHQIPERSFHIFGHQFAVCSRCFGVYAGLLAGIAFYPVWRPVESIEPLPRFWLFLSMIPISIDWALGVFGIWENNHFSRFVTGLILGAACGIFILPALVEIVRNLMRRSPPSGIG